MFNDLLKSKGLESIEWLVREAVQMDDVWDDESDVVSIPMEKSTEIVKKKVLNYLPLGPYKERVFFVKRTLCNPQKNE